MTLWENNEVLLCRCFATSLGETALKWYYQLPHGSVDSYRNLTELFCARFISSSRPLKGLPTCEWSGRAHGTLTEVKGITQGLLEEVVGPPQ